MFFHPIFPFFSLLQSLINLIIKKSLGIKRGHATGSGTGDGLTIDMILHVASSKYTRYAGLCRIASA
jgi:hypothetical protein